MIEVRCDGHYKNHPPCGWSGERGALRTGCCPVCGGGHIADVLSLAEEFNEATVEHIINRLEKRAAVAPVSLYSGDHTLIQAALAALKRERERYQACLREFTIEGDMTESNPVLAALKRITAAAVEFKKERDDARAVKSDYGAALAVSGLWKEALNDLLEETIVVLQEHRCASPQFIERLREAMKLETPPENLRGASSTSASRPAHRTAHRQPPLAAVPRPSWPETWMAIARVIAERSYDPRLKVGAIIVTADNTQMLAGGYNGNYAGGPNVQDSPKPGESGFIHAETNALLKMDFNHPKEKIMYVTHSPCVMCAKLIVNAGIKRVVYEIAYRDPAGIELLQTAGVSALSLRDAVVVAGGPYKPGDDFFHPGQTVTETSSGLEGEVMWAAPAPGGVSVAFALGARLVRRQDLKPREP